MKKIFLGFVCGALAVFCITAFAAQMEVYDNPYKVTVDGREVQIQGYNIDGSTYFKLRDIGEAVNFDVGFENDTIVITTRQPGPGNGGIQPGMTLEQMKEKLEQDVADGKITQEKADEVLSKFSSMPNPGEGPDAETSTETNAETAE